MFVNVRLYTRVCTLPSSDGHPPHQKPSRTAGMGHRQVMEMEELMNAGWLSHGVWLDGPQMKECVKLGCI